MVYAALAGAAAGLSMGLSPEEITAGIAACCHHSAVRLQANHMTGACGDFHDIGKNLVKMMMEGNGLEVVDLGVDVAPEAYVAAAKEHNADIIACSALLTTTMAEMKNVVDLCVAEGIRENVKIMIGGAPITDEYCREIGADVYTSDAASAADAALALCGG